MGSMEITMRGKVGNVRSVPLTGAIVVRDSFYPRCRSSGHLICIAVLFGSVGLLCHFANRQEVGQVLEHHPKYSGNPSCRYSKTSWQEKRQVKWIFKRHII